MDVQIRPATDGEFEAAARSLEIAFGGVFEDDLDRKRLVAESGRWHVAVSDGAIVGGAAAMSMSITVPGPRQLRAAGITAVGVLPTHTRRGINTSLMRTQLDDIDDRGEPLAVLVSTEGGIYERYGYGMATLHGDLDLEVARSGFVRNEPVPGDVDLVERTEALELMRPVYDAEQALRPGMIQVDDQRWRWLFFDDERKGAPPAFYVVFRSGHDVEGFARYRICRRWQDSVARFVVEVDQLIASTPRAYAGLWRYMSGIDRAESVTARRRPSDEPLLHLLLEPRRMRFRMRDGLYVRIVDPVAALESRSYAGEGTLVIEVVDEFLPANKGRYALEVTEKGASCELTTVRPHLACTISELGAVFLGGVRFRTLERAGRVDELDPGALALADGLFASDPAPWCPMDF